MPAPTISTGNITTASYSSPSASEIVIGKPTDIAVDDVMLIIAMSDQSNVGVDVYGWPSGFTEIIQGGDGTSDAHVGAAYKVIDGGEGSSFQLTSNYRSGVEFELWGVELNGVDTASVVDAVSSVTISAGSSPFSISGITAASDTLGFYIMGFDSTGAGDGPPFGAPSTWTEQAEAAGAGSGDISGCWGYKSDPGTTGSLSVTHSANDGRVGVVFSINGTAAGGLSIPVASYHYQHNIGSN